MRHSYPRMNINQIVWHQLSNLLRYLYLVCLFRFNLFVSKMEDILQHTQNPALLRAVQEMLEACSACDSEMDFKQPSLNTTSYLNG